MIEEQIKSEIARQIDERSKKDLNLLTLPLISQYRCLLWSGPANGAFMTPNFVIADIQNKTLVIKSIKLVPYAQTAQYRDMFFSDGTFEALPQFSRLDRLFDNYRDGFRIQLLINGTQVNIFGWVPSAGGFTVGFPVDFFIDNVYYKYPERITDITFQITGTVYENINTGALDNPFLKVMMEVYLL